MRFEVIFQIVAALVVAVSASPISTTSPPRHVVHERRSEPPPNWSRHSRLHPASVFPVRIGLTQQNLHRAEEFVNQVAHPASNDCRDFCSEFRNNLYCQDMVITVWD
jgi:tripeptidyl-peptidase-1